MENYKTIPFEDNYEVSDWGNVRNINTKHVKSLRYDKYGYLRVTLYPSGTTYAVHRLVGRVWLSKTYEDGLQIDHLNAKRDDNTLTNLEWVTPKVNCERVMFRPSVKGSSNPMSKLTEKLAYDIKYDFTGTTKQTAQKYNCTVGMVEAIRRREDWCHVVDVTLEELFLSGDLVYPRGITANLTEDNKKLLIEDLLSELYTTKELVGKYSCSKSAVCRWRRKLGL